MRKKMEAFYLDHINNKIYLFLVSYEQFLKLIGPFYPQNKNYYYYLFILS